MSLIKPMVSSKTNEWATPKSLFDYLDKEFNFTLDPCATLKNAKCNKFYTIADDGLSKNWTNEIIFMNPPYGGHTGKWLMKAVESAIDGSKVVCLIVSSTDRSYWHEIIYPFSAEIRFMRGRVKFGESKSTAPFASAIVIFDNKRRKLSCNPYPDINFVDYRKFHQ